MLWQFPNCGGAIDGKHVRITQPHNSGSFYFNYKGYYSIILMAVVNANYKFISVDVGINRRVSDGGVFKHTTFGQRLLKSKLNLPQSQSNFDQLNFVFLVDEAFPLQKNLLRPYPQSALNPARRIFNYRLCRARRVVENAFGIMSNRFRIFHTPINLKIDSIDKVVLACCVLHNFLRKRDELEYVPPGFVDVESSSDGQIIPGACRQHDRQLDALNPIPTLSRSRTEALAKRENIVPILMAQVL
ncbi:uncharacterized protein ACNLHF_023212 [Anomaloglossus baeobatrachus]